MATRSSDTTTRSRRGGTSRARDDDATATRRTATAPRKGGSSTKTASKGGGKAGTKAGTKAGSKGGSKGGSKAGPSRASTTTKVTSRSSGGGGAKGRGGSGGRGGSAGRGGSGGGRRADEPTGFWSHLAEQRRDVAGIGLLLLGVLAGLGTYADAAGPVGSFLEAVALGLLGLAGYLVPILIAWFGLLVVIGRPDPEIGRIAVGSLLLLVGVLGALHLGADLPHPSDGMRGLWRAGGLLGWAVTTPLAAALSTWGAGAVLAALIVLGSLVVTRTPVSTVVATVRDLFSRPSVDDDTDAADEDDRPGAAASSGRTRASRRRDGADAAGDTAHLDVPADDPDAAGATSPDATDVLRPTPVRATLAGTAASQPHLDGIDDEDPADGDGQAASRGGSDPEGAGTEVARAPDPPTDAASAGKLGKARKVAPVTDWGDYQLPPLKLLAGGRSMGRESTRTIDAQVAALQETFHQFGIDATVARWSRGPTVTRFEIELGPGVQVKKVANMGDDIAYALAAPDVRIVAPIPGKSAIGVEVPNRQRDLITLGDILRSDLARRDPHPLTVALGVDIAGEPELVNLATMPHLLVSGATGSGKSVTLNGMISSILMRARPDQVRMILIDPKRVELNAYQGAPHLLSPVVTDPRRATDAVQWCVKEMEQRYELLAQLGYRNIDGYNDAVATGEVAARPGPPGEDGEPTELEPQPLPYILLVIDELADLMLVAPRDVEDAICRIAQMARAVGIHMIIATQRPSVDVITGLIKANIPSRLALAVASQTDSRTILDMNGAEKLVGKGDMLFLPASQGKPSRLQGCWVTEKEIVQAVELCKAQREPEFEDAVVRTGEAAERTDAARSGDDTSDEALLRRAAEQVVVSGLGSTSMLQRKLRIGFARAGRLMDELEELGVVGPNEGSKARDVLWSPEEFDDAVSRGAI